MVMMIIEDTMKLTRARLKRMPVDFESTFWDSAWACITSPLLPVGI